MCGQGTDEDFKAHRYTSFATGLICFYDLPSDPLQTVSHNAPKRNSIV